MKRLLALDGGGIRGLFSLKVLERIERELRNDLRKPDLVLADYFHYIGGTSTGAIIATCLAWGMSVEEVIKFYTDEASSMFKKSRWFHRHKAKFQGEGLRRVFQETFSEDDGQPALLGTGKLRTFLLVVTRNASTGSPWPITNNPGAKYNQRDKPGCNLMLPLWQLVRASTAAPTYFPPEVVTIRGKRDEKGVRHAFEDGGVTPYNNPAFLLYLKATLPEYKMEWPQGVEELSLVSIGTGVEPAGRGQRHELNLLQAATALPTSLIGTFSQNQDLLCRTVGECRFGPKIDSELGDLVRPNPRAAFRYTRYDHAFTPADYEEARRFTKHGITLDNLELMPFLLELGKRYAEDHVKLPHFHSA